MEGALVRFQGGVEMLEKDSVAPRVRPVPESHEEIVSAIVRLKKH